MDDNGDFETLYAFGGRSFSIWTPAGEQVFDSGDALEQLTAARYPDFSTRPATTTALAPSTTAATTKVPNPRRSSWAASTGGPTLLSRSSLPDLVIGAIMFVIVSLGAVRILRLAR